MNYGCMLSIDVHEMLKSDKMIDYMVKEQISCSILNGLYGFVFFGLATKPFEAMNFNT